MSASLNVFGDTSHACAALARKDKALDAALNTIGEPYIRRRPGGFEALFRIIVEQQVSVPSAQAIWARCGDNFNEMTPAEALRQGKEGLRVCGLSGPKIRYVLALAEDMENGALDLQQLETLDDQAAAELLQQVKGIGPWTAAIYLLFCEGRVDIWPRGDVALLGAYRTARQESKVRGPAPEMKQFDEKAAKWTPYRGVAAHILWTYYAHCRGRTPI